jgi:hypothetical protein
VGGEGERKTTNLYHSLAAHEVRSAAHSDTAPRCVLDEIAARDETAEVAELRGAVGVGKDGVVAPDMAEAVGYGTALAAILLQRHDAQDVVQVVAVGEGQCNVDGGIAAAVVDEEDLIACGAAL